MNPTMAETNINWPMTDISTSFIQTADTFIADKVFPIVPVDAQSALYYEFNKGDFFRIEVRERAPATESPGAGFDLTTAPVYFARVYAVHKDIDDQTRAASANLFNLERASTIWVTQQLLLQRERRWADSFFKTGVWGTELTGVTGTPSGAQFKRWDDATSTPIEDITNQIILMAESTAFKPNTLVIAPRVLNALMNHPQIIDRVKFTGQTFVTVDILAQLFGVQRVVTPWGIVNNGAKGAADAFSFIYGKHALLTYASDVPDLMTQSGGYIFAWTGYAGAGAFGNRISSFRIDARRADRIEGELAYDMKITDNTLGIFFANAVS
jgi:hypothetical protein